MPNSLGSRLLSSALSVKVSADGRSLLRSLNNSSSYGRNLACAVLWEEFRERVSQMLIKYGMELKITILIPGCIQSGQ